MDASDAASHRPVLLVMAIFSRYPDAIQAGIDLSIEHWGPVALLSERFVFDQTRYYQQQMGDQLQKQLVAYRQLIDPETLPERKRQSGSWEAAIAANGSWPEVRPLNLDPGYLTEAKLVLATTKDRDHRIFLNRGIFGEVTLSYRNGAWHSREWTYPDYQQAGYHRFLIAVVIICGDATGRVEPDAT